MWTRRAWFPFASAVADRVRAHPGADPDRFAVTDRLAVRSGIHRVSFAHPDAGCDRDAVTEANRSSDATPDRDADPTSHGSSDATPDRDADATSDHETDADAVAAEPARPARLADE